MNRWSAVMVLGILLSGCGPDVSAPPGTDVSGTYIGPSVRGLRATGPNADAASDTATVPDSATYTLRIRDNDGFVHGVWTSEGDTAQPSDPWEAVITGDYTDGRMVLEYYSPTKGQCHLAGGMTGDFYTPEHLCADDWSAVDTLQLVKLDTLSMACSPGSQVWMSIPVCAEGEPRRLRSRRLREQLPIRRGGRTRSSPGCRSQVYTPYSCTLFDIRAAAPRPPTSTTSWRWRRPTTPGWTACGSEELAEPDTLVPHDRGPEKNQKSQGCGGLEPDEQQRLVCGQCYGMSVRPSGAGRRGRRLKPHGGVQPIRLRKG